MKDSIIEIMTDILKIEQDELLENFDSREIWDSLLRVEILFAVEEEFDIQFDEEELAEGKWCTRDEIPEDDGVSLTREMMRVFKEGKI